MALKSRVILTIFFQHQCPLPSVNENDIYDVSTKAKSGWVSLSSVQCRAAVLAEHVMTLLNNDQGA